MRISEISIRRPVFATVMSLMIVLIGVVSFDRLSVREYPRIDEPVVTVTTKLVGASSEVIESQVTKPLEDSIAGIDGVDIITSISRSEQSQITVRFKLERNPDDAAADVRDRVSRVRARLPEAVDEPVIAKVEADATPTIWLAFTSETLSPLQVTDVINRIEARIGLRLPGKVEVLEGLAAGDLVVTAGQARLGRGEAVPLRVVDLSRPAGDATRPAGSASGPRAPSP